MRYGARAGALAAIGWLAVPSDAAADTPLPPYLGQGFALDAFQSAPPGDRFLVVPDAGAAADGRTNELSGRIIANRAIAPLAIQSNGGSSRSQALGLDLALAFAVGHLFLFDAEIPLVLKQRVWADDGESGPPSQPAPVPSAGDAGDMRIGARVPLPITCSCEAAQLALATDLWFKSGDENTLTGDGVVRFDARVNWSGQLAALEYAFSGGYLFGPNRAFGESAKYSGMGPGVSIKAGAGFRVPEGRSGVDSTLHLFRAALEYVEEFPISTGDVATVPFTGKSPGELMVTAAQVFQTYDGYFTFRFGVGAGLTHAPGEPEERVLFGLEYTTIANRHHDERE